jgi:hypothetical protein
MLAFDRFRHPHRDFTQFLENWAQVEKRLSK